MRAALESENGAKGKNGPPPPKVAWFVFGAPGSARGAHLDWVIYPQTQ